MTMRHEPTANCRDPAMADLEAKIDRLRDALVIMCRGWKNGDLTEGEFLDAWDLAHGEEQAR